LRFQGIFKYAPPGSPIELTGGVERDALIFRVNDHGNGIPASERDRVFTPFYRSPKASGQQSSGLGLSIARRLAEAQGGALTYEDRSGGGATFELRLPAVSPYS